jgi:hypothetical protein
MIGNLNTWKISLNNESAKNVLLNSFEIKKNHLTYLLDTNKTEYSAISV